MSLTAKCADDRGGLIEAVVYSDVVVGTMLGAGADGPHGAGHDVLAALPVDVELLVLDVELDKRLTRVQPVLAMQGARVDTWVRRALNVACLQAAVLRTRPIEYIFFFLKRFVIDVFLAKN